MCRKVLCLAVAVVVIATVCVFSYLASAAPQGKGNDRVLSKIKFIHYKAPRGKPPGTPGSKPDKEDEGYYTYLAKGAKWKAPEVFLLNLWYDNTDEVTPDLVAGAVEAGMSAWENADDPPLAIFNDLMTKDTPSYLDLDVLQGENTISFRPFGSPNVIAQAIVWGYFGGPPSQREIIEAHIEFNDDFLWGVVEGPKDPFMDVQNIVTHELGHCAGMGDLYLTAAIEETMYGYSDEGETYKCDLDKGDIAGITNLYQ